METSRTNAQYKRNDRYNLLLYEIEGILSVLWIFFRTTDTKDTTIWKPGYMEPILWQHYTCLQKKCELYLTHYLVSYLNVLPFTIANHWIFMQFATEFLLIVLIWIMRLPSNATFNHFYMKNRENCNGTIAYMKKFEL